MHSYISHSQSRFSYKPTINSIHLSCFAKKRMEGFVECNISLACFLQSFLLIVLFENSGIILYLSMKRICKRSRLNMKSYINQEVVIKRQIVLKIEFLSMRPYSSGVGISVTRCLDHFSKFGHLQQ